MKLPGGEDARVPSEKVSGYLLSGTHPVGRLKARFFRAAGFEEPEQLEEALFTLAQHGTVISEVSTDIGQKYIVDGSLETPSGADVPVRSVWIREHGEETPRLVTYPREGA